MEDSLNFVNRDVFVPEWVAECLIESNIFELLDNAEDRGKILHDYISNRILDVLEAEDKGYIFVPESEWLEIKKSSNEG